MALTSLGFKRMFTNPLVRHSDMPDGLKDDAVLLCSRCCDQFKADNQLAARVIKETMDKHYGGSWHAVVGDHGLYLIKTGISAGYCLLSWLVQNDRGIATNTWESSTKTSDGNSVYYGEQFGFEVTHEVQHLLYLFVGGNLAVCLWKCT